MTETEMLTYLTEAAEPPPCLGDPLVLRLRQDGGEIEAFAPNGRRLGRVPPAEGAALGQWLAEGRAMPGRVSALVPRPGRGGVGRVHVTLFAA